MKKLIAFTDPKDLEWFHSLSEEQKKEMFHEPIIYENIEDNPAVIQMTQEEYDIWVKENGLIDATPFLNNLRKI